MLSLLMLASAVGMKNYPIKLRNVISKMKDSTQSALKNRVSRMEVELPPAVDFGIEKGGIFDNLPEIEKIKRSNREAARLFTEMFSMLGSTTCVLFTTEAEARAAKSSFKGFSGQCISIDSAGKSAKGFSNLRSRRFTAEEQEAALLGSDGIYVPDETEVLIIPGPRAKDFKKIKKLHEKFGEGTLIILLNSRVDAVEILAGDGDDGGLNWVREGFHPVFSYCPPVIINQQGAAESRDDLLLYHEYQDKWYVACNKNGGDKGSMLGNIAMGMAGAQPFTTLMTSEKRMSPRELSDALNGSIMG